MERCLKYETKWHITWGNHDFMFLWSDPKKSEVVLRINVTDCAPGFHRQLVKKTCILNRCRVVQRCSDRNACYEIHFWVNIFSIIKGICTRWKHWKILVIVKRKKKFWPILFTDNNFNLFPANVFVFTWVLKYSWSNCHYKFDYCFFLHLNDSI